ncbi:Halomucin [Frankliniella fusca]|uniref:Halomucin n=1 Tax=Frankliniella fusca TaxID=407009 RepID=A0AAE1LAJ3_9NEOP|nr:Halomucin [Frankliniella fusca]
MSDPQLFWTGMSDNNEHGNNQDSLPSSPNLLPTISSDSSSNPSLNSSDRENQSHDSSELEVSDHSSTYSHASPPTSPVKAKKRPAYGAYKNDPTIPIPRQTLHTWKKRRVDDHSTNNDPDSPGSEDNTVNENESMTRGPLASHVHGTTEESSQGSSSSNDNENLSQSTNSYSDSSDDESETGNESVDGQNEQNSSYNSSCRNDSDFSDNNGNDSDSTNTSDENDPFEDVRLWPGCEKTKEEAIYELINVYLSKKLTKNALTEILRIYITSLPPNNVMPSSVYLLFKYVKNLSLPLDEKENYYCRPMQHPVDLKLGPCSSCGSVDIGVFYELSLENTLKFLFEQRGLADLIDSYSETRSQRGDYICDITDGSEYSRVWGDNANKYKVTLILNTDGVSPHPSSKARFWPLMFTVMEIPPHLRPSFTIVWGIWFDKKMKPDMNLYLKPFVSSLVEIERNGGVSWMNPSTGTNHISPVRAPFIVADAPARAAILNMQEHGGKYACNTCEQKTSKLPAPPPIPDDRILACANKGTGLKPKKGIKGFTVVRDIPFLDLSTCVLAEYMHSVLCGVVKQICSLWFFEKGPWYIGDHLTEINNFIDKEIHPPDFVSRIPRSFEHFSLFKANEFRTYLLYFSLIIVAPYLKDQYHQHWMLFVQAIFMLLKDSISQSDLQEAEVLLRLFVRDLGSLYGNKQYVYNCHQVLHLCLYVSRWGCLWSNSACSFEGMNGILADMIHGSKNEGKELLNQLPLAQGNQMLKNKIVKDAKKKSGLSVLGKALTHTLTESELKGLQDLNVNMQCLEFYGRIEVGREIFSCKINDKSFRRRNSYVEIECGGRTKYGRIIVFCKSGNTIFCIVSVLRVLHMNFFVHKATKTRIRHIIPVEDSGECIVTEARNIIQKLIQIGDFLCFRPNSIERNL